MGELPQSSLVLTVAQLAAEGGCWGLQQAGAGSGQARTHAAGPMLTLSLRATSARTAEHPPVLLPAIETATGGSVLNIRCRRCRCGDAGGIPRKPEPRSCCLHIHQSHQLCSGS